MGNALVTRIVRDSVLDGPGCRYVVFVKGCNLNCPWCHNPEAKSSKQEILTYQQFCIHCENCVKVGPKRGNSEKTPVIIDYSQTEKYFQCVEECNTSALEFAGKEYSSDEIIDDMQKFRIIYSRTNGGLTISGGDPLFVPEFSLELFSKAKNENFHTAADTALTYKYELIEKFIPVVDLWLVDLKHVSDNEVKSSLTIENLFKLAKLTNTKIWIRIPVIPDYNDNEKIWNEMASLLKEAGRAIEQVALLPFHPYGFAKYEALRLKYDYAGSMPLDNNVLENARKIFSKYLSPEILKLGRRLLQG